MERSYLKGASLEGESNESEYERCGMGPCVN